MAACAWTRLHSALLLCFAAVVFAVYFATMFPSISGGDSGEMVAIACLGAVPHPPGYPLWTLLYMAWMWAFRAFAKPAYLANLLTVLLSVGASVVLVLCVRQYVYIALEQAVQPAQEPLGRTREQQQQQQQQQPQPPKKSRSKPRQTAPTAAAAAAAMSTAAAADLETAAPRDREPGVMADIGLWVGVFASGLYSFSPQIWHYANQAEVFALNNVLCALILYIAALYFQRPNLRLACLQAFVCGCALSNQHTSVLFVVPVAISTLVAAVNEPARDPQPGVRVLSVRGFVLMSVCALAGLSFYLHLPIAAYRDALDSWGDHSTLRGFLTHFLRSEYGTFQLASGVGEEQDLAKVLRRMRLFLEWFSRDTLHLGVPLVLTGLLASCVSRRKELLLLSFCYVFYFVFMNTLSNLTFSDLHMHVTARMWQQAHVAGCVLAGVGAASLACWLSRGVAMKHRSSFAARACGLAAPVIAVVLAAQCARWYATMDNSENYTYYNYGKALLDPLPDEAVLLLNDDANCNTAHYLLRCETPRPGIQFIRLQLITYNWWKKAQHHHFPHLQFPGTRHHPHDPLGFNMKAMLDANFKNPVMPFYIAGDWKEGDDSQDVYQRIPVGLAQRVLPPGEVLGIEELVEAMKRASLLQYWPDTALNFNRSNVYSGSWDEVIMWKTYTHLYQAAQQLAIREGEMPANSQLRREGLRLALDLFKAVHKMCSHRRDLLDRTDAQLWHNAGVVAGLLATTVGQGDPEYLALSRDMFDFWELHVKVARSNGRGKIDTRNIEIILRDRVNPWTGHKLGDLLR